MAAVGIWAGEICQLLLLKDQTPPKKTVKDIPLLKGYHIFVLFQHHGIVWQNQKFLAT